MGDSGRRRGRAGDNPSENPNGGTDHSGVGAPVEFPALMDADRFLSSTSPDVIGRDRPALGWVLKAGPAAGRRVGCDLPWHLPRLAPPVWHRDVPSGRWRDVGRHRETTAKDAATRKAERRQVRREQRAKERAEENRVAPSPFKHKKRHGRVAFLAALRPA